MMKLTGWKQTSLRAALVAAVFWVAVDSGAQTQFEIQSSVDQVHLLELYSSEGCSSCPPAEAFLASLRARGALWRTFVPVEFHVDYWNRLGWVDRFSRDTYTRRQHEFAARWGSSSVYTPGFVLDGREWKSSFPSTAEILAPGRRVGRLSAKRVGEASYRVRFEPAAGIEATGWTVTGVLLANGLRTEVRSGENSGRTLKHEFVVVSHRCSPPE